jgi:hypothetical protein
VEIVPHISPAGVNLGNFSTNSIPHRYYVEIIPLYPKLIFFIEFFDPLYLARE